MEKTNRKRRLSSIQRSDSDRQTVAREGNIDFGFLTVVLMLVLLGLIMVFSASYPSANYKYGDGLYFIKKQALWAVIGVGVMLGATKINYWKYKKYLGFIVGGTFVLLLLVLASSPINGARRWLGFGSFSFQPSEAAKIAVIIYLAAGLSNAKEKIKDLRYLVRFGVVLAAFFLLLALEPHFSACIIIGLVAVIMFILGGMRMKHFWIAVGIVVPIAVVYAFSADYRVARIMMFFDPFVDPRGDGWQIIQSLYAIGSGGLFGLGFGNSRQKYMYVSEPQNDFIFAIICEELGMVGAVVIIALFVFLVWRGMKIAINAPDTFSSLLASGITSLVGIQTFLNIGVVIKMIPTTGVSLPFFSAGGSSLVFLMAAMGIVLNISKFKK